MGDVATDATDPVFSDQIRTLYRQAPGNLLTTLVASSVVAVVLWNELPLTRVGVWLAAALLISALRFLLLWQFARSRPAIDALRRWSRLYTASAAAAGLLWGSSAFVLYVDDSVVHQAFLFVVVAGMMGGAAVSLNVYLPTFYAFILPIGVGFVTRMAMAASLDSAHGRVMLAWALLLTWWSGGIYFFGRIANQSLVNAFRVGWENGQLSDRLAAKMAELEHANRQLGIEIEAHGRTEADLQRAKLRLDLALEASQTSTWDWTLTENIVYLDARWSSMLGGEPRETRTTVEELCALVHPDDIRHTLAAQVACLKGETSQYVVDHRVRAASGEWLWIVTRGRVVERDAAGRALRMSGTNRNVTARKRAEEAVRNANVELEAKTKKLAAVNRDLEAFTYTISHDLRAPLRHIAGFLVVLQNHLGARIEDNERKLIERITGASTRMNRMIEDLLAFSRTTTVGIRKTEVPLRPVVDEIVAELAPDAQDRRIEWIVGELPTLWGDRNLLKLALFNVVGNAVKYTRPRAIGRIEIGSYPRAGMHVVTVKDNGVGFNMKYAHKLFGVFERLHDGQEFEGTGIGLASVARIVERHGGEVWAESVEGEGTTLFVAVPAEPGSKP